MAERLKNTLSFTDLAAGASITIAHGLNTGVGGPRPLAPDIVFIPSPDLEVAGSDALNITLTNRGPTPLSGTILVEAWHTLERAFNGAQNTDLPVKPYVVVSVENNGAPPLPPFPVPPITTEIFVRTGGNDVTGTGTLANPYATLPRAARDVPINIPPGYYYKINNTGTTESLPVDYTLPAWKGSLNFIGDLGKRFWHLKGLVTIEADPELVPLVPASAATINPGDVLSAVNDPISNLVTITINAARPSWTNANLKGKHLIGAAVGVEQCEILEVTTTTLLIASDFAPTFPADIMQESAHLSGTQDVLGAITAYNCDSLCLHGQEISEVSGLAALFVDGIGTLVLEFCTVQNPFLSNVGAFQSKFIDCRVYGDFIVFGQNSVAVTFSFFDNCTGISLVDSLATLPVFRNCMFEACDPIEPRTFVPFEGEFPHPVNYLSMANCLVKDGLGDGMILHGSAGRLLNVDIQNCAGNGLVVNDGVGLTKLENVGSSLPNGGFGLLVNDGQFVKADAATYGAALPLTGAGGDMKVGNGAMRTWSDYATGADDRPPLLELDFTSFADTGGTFSDAAAAAAYVIGTGSKVYS